MRLDSNLLYRLIKEQLDETNTDFSQWKVNAHHVTLNMGSWKGAQPLGTWFNIEVDGFYVDDKVAAVRVTNLSSESGEQLSRSNDANKMHITIAVSPTGKAKDSNLLPWDNTPNQQINLRLKGQLHDPKGVQKDGKEEYKTEGGYSGVVLTKDEHGRLMKELAARGLVFNEASSQKWAEGSPSSTTRESLTVSLSRIRTMIREELSRARRK